jgi:Icc-related predicted phosphoesterase
MRHDSSATADVIRLMVGLTWRRIRGQDHPAVVLSHAPPLGVGDRAADPFHVGFSAYRWLLDRIRPPLWLHGHVHPASVEGWRLDHDGSMVVNVTGAVLVEIEPPPGSPESGGGEPTLR